MPELPGSPGTTPEGVRSVPTDAGATREPQKAPAEGSTGRARFMQALVSRPTRGQALVAVLLAAAGFAATTQVQSNERDDHYAGLRQSGLIRVFDVLSGHPQRTDRGTHNLTGHQQGRGTERSHRQATPNTDRNRTTD